MKFCKIVITIIFMTTFNNRQDSKWDMFSRQNEEVLRCVQSNKIKESEIEIIKKGRPKNES